MTSRLRVVMLVSAVIVSLALMLTGSQTAVGAQQAERVTFAQDWFIHGKHVLFYPAIDHGTYQKHGLAVSIVRGFGSGDTIQKVDQKKVEFGFADLASLVLLRAKGARVVGVGMIHHLMPHAIFFLKDSGIKSPKDLEGRTFATPAGNAVWVLLPAFAKATGFDHTKIRQVPADAAASNAAVLAGKVDVGGIFWTSYPTVAAEAKKIGKEMAHFRYGDYGLELYSNSLIVHEDLVREKPELVQRFVKATFEGVHWALKNPEAALDLYMKHNRDQDREKVRGEWVATMELFGAVAKNARTPLQLAWMDPAKVAKTVEIIGELYKLESPVKPGDIYTNRFAEPLR